MILEVSFDKTIYNELPYKFEAGTPNISGVVGLGAAIDYLQTIGMQDIARYEHDLHDYMVAELRKVDGIRLIGEARNAASVQSFQLDDIHSHDLGTILDHQGVAIRTGHHCAMPVMQHFGISGTSRASLALYNNRDDVDRLIAALGKAKEIFRMSDTTRDMQDLYRELVLDHSRNPRHFRSARRCYSHSRRHQPSVR